MSAEAPAGDREWMQRALELADHAAAEGEVPVGAVLVRDGEELGAGWNAPVGEIDPTAHAEMIAITSASNAIGSKYLGECSLYVTLEPCAMCAGASYWSQMQKIVFGASDEKRGYSALNKKLLHPKTEVVKGIMQDECAALLHRFFERLR